MEQNNNNHTMLDILLDVLLYNWLAGDGEELMDKRTGRGGGKRDSRWIRGYPDEYCRRSLGVNIFFSSIVPLLFFFLFFSFFFYSLPPFSSIIPTKSNLQSSICTFASQLPYYLTTLPPYSTYSLRANKQIF